MATGRLFVFFCLLSGANSLQFSPELQNGAMVYACSGGIISLPWTLNSTSGLQIMNIQWYHEGRSHDIIATLANDVFFPSTSFNGRVTQLSNAGLELSHVTLLDGGNYSVEVIARDGEGDVVTLHSTVVVQVADSLQTTDGHLHVVQQAEAEYNETDDQFHVVLSCGTFKYPTHPPFIVSWLTPSGETLNSTTYAQDQFHLKLPNPVQGGTYTCKLPRGPACLLDNDAGEATVNVDTMETRMAVLEARQARLEGKNKESGTESGDLRAEIERLTNLSRQAVSFHARMSSNLQLPPASVVPMSTIVHNQAHAYDGDSGVFTAPYSGVYCFLASVEVTTSQLDATLSLRVESREVDFVWITSDTKTKAGGVQAVVHMTAGQRAWLQNTLNSAYWSQPSSFSGFLVSPDP